MFEAVMITCVGLANEFCRDVLIPGYEAPTKAACEARAPKDAECRPLGPALDFVEVAPGVFAHLGRIEEPDQTNRGDVSNIGFVVGENSVAVVDSGSALWMGEAIWRAIQAHTDKPVSHVILTHMHPDHVFGARFFRDATIVGHQTLPRALIDRRENYLESLQRLIGAAAFVGTDIPEVTVTVDASMKIDLGARVLSLRAWPTAHTGSDVTVMDDTTETLFTGDLVFHQHTPALDGSLRGWQQVLNDLSEMNISQIVPGHGGPVLPWPAASDDLMRYLDVLAHDTTTAISKGERLGDAVQHIAQSEAHRWTLFEAYNTRNATVAFTELEWE